MMLDIFSSKILFSRSISVYLPDTMDEHQISFLTFKHGILFGIANPHLGLEGPALLGPYGRLDFSQLFLVDHEIFLAPFAVQELA